MDAHRYAGMTVNERLSSARLMESFDAAARARDRATMIALLEQVELSAQQVSETVDAILRAPKFYGY